MSRRHQLLSIYDLITDQVDKDEIDLLLTELEKQLNNYSEGSFVEFGCYRGTTSLFLARLLLQYGRAPSKLHVYDSFAGLPVKDDKDISPLGHQFRSGELMASKADFVRSFVKAQVPLPTVHKAWFKDLKADDVPRDIRFAFLDGDFHASVLTPLRLIESRLMSGAVVIVDDYTNQALPGAARAVNEWLLDTPRHLKRPMQQRYGMAIISIA